MDPTEHLRVLRQHARLTTDPANLRRTHHAERVVELFTDLDGWLTTGGFLPAPWRTDLSASEPTLVEEVQRELDAHPTWNPERTRRALARRNEATHPLEVGP